MLRRIMPNAANSTRKKRSYTCAHSNSNTSNSNTSNSNSNLVNKSKTSGVFLLGRAHTTVVYVTVGMECCFEPAESRLQCGEETPPSIFLFSFRKQQEQNLQVFPTRPDPYYCCLRHCRYGYRFEPTEPRLQCGEETPPLISRFMCTFVQETTT